MRLAPLRRYADIRVEIQIGMCTTLRNDANRTHVHMSRPRPQDRKCLLLDYIQLSAYAHIHIYIYRER